MSPVKLLPVSNPKSFGPMERFCNQVSELGGVILEDHFLGARIPHRCICTLGHECTPRPDNVRSRNSICQSCHLITIHQSRTSVAYAEYRELLQTLDATWIEQEWLGMKQPHWIKCKNGHVVNPYPYYVKDKLGLCRVCAKNDTVTARDAFLKILFDRQAIMLGAWRGCNKTVEIRCRYGHHGNPYPGNVLSGLNFCRYCAHRVWDIIYVVTNPMNGTCKFGITSGNPAPRLANHFRDGYWNQERVYTNITNALDIERLIKSDLKAKGFQSTHGTEHFNSECLPTILDIVDHNVRKSDNDRPR